MEVDAVLGAAPVPGSCSWVDVWVASFRGDGDEALETDGAGRGRGVSCAVHAGSSRNETIALKSSREDILMTGIGSGFFAQFE